MIQDLGKVWEQVKADDELKAMVVYSSLPVVFSAGADIKAFTEMDTPGGAELINTGHALLRELGQNSKSTVAAINAIAFGGGCELAMACDFRVAADSAVFGQPEINLGIIPGFGGTQRLPRLVGPSKALEMNLTGDAVLAPEARSGASPTSSFRTRSCSTSRSPGLASSPARRRSRSSRSSRSPTRATSTRASRPRSRASPRRSSPRTARRASRLSSRSGAKWRASSRHGRRPSASLS